MRGNADEFECHWEFGISPELLGELLHVASFQDGSTDELHLASC